MSDLQEMARRTAVGMCAQIAQGRDDEANELMAGFFSEATEAGYTLVQGLVALVRMLTALAVAASENDSEWFLDLAQRLAVKS